MVRVYHNGRSLSAPRALAFLGHDREYLKERNPERRRTRNSGFRPGLAEAVRQVLADSWWHSLTRDAIAAELQRRGELFDKKDLCCCLQYMANRRFIRKLPGPLRAYQL